MRFLRYILSMLAIAMASSSLCYANTVFIGDSRTVGIYDVLHNTSTANEVNINKTDANGDVWSCKVGMGLKWMKNTGIPQVESKITDGTDVVILMGVNDVADSWAVNNYISYINEKSAEWTEKGADVYYMSIMPVKNDTKYVKNTGINIWNETMKSQLVGAEYVDIANGGIKYNFRDTYHFKNQTSLEIYNYIVEYLKKNRSLNLTYAHG